MLERNKTIFKILLIVSAVIFVGGLIALLLRHPIVWVDVCSYAGMIVWINVLAMLPLKYPKINSNYTLSKRTGKWRFAKVDYSNDPNGYAYIMTGMLCLFLTILLTIFNLIHNDTIIICSAIILSAILIACCIHFTNKIKTK